MEIGSTCITSQEELTEAICGYTAQAADKLRRQQSVCSFITVFAKNSAFSKHERYILSYTTRISDLLVVK